MLRFCFYMAATVLSILALCFGASAFQGPVVGPGTPGLLYDMTVHADPTDSTRGWVIDQLGNAIYGNSSNTQPYPLVWALEHTGSGAGQHGRKINLDGGAYANMKFQTVSSAPNNVNTMVSSSGAPVVITGTAGATIKSNPVGGSNTVTVFGSSGHPFNFITWKNVRFEGSGWAALFFGFCSDPASGITYKNWRFLDCEIDGLYDHKTQTGFNSKWGVLSWSLEGFLWDGGSVHGIRNEHAFYMHSNMGSVTIKNADIYEVGRTGVQIVARPSDSGCTNIPVNPGAITIQDNHFADTGLEPGDYHAGTTITITGRNNGTTTITGNTIEYGLDTFTPGLRAAILAQPNYPPGKPYGSGAIIFFGEIALAINNSNAAVITGNTVTYQAASGDRQALWINNLNSAEVRCNTITMGARTNAIDLGNCANPSDAFHSVPLAYCVAGNTLIPGNAGAANVSVVGVGCPTTQPVSLGMSCSSICP